MPADNQKPKDPISFRCPYCQRKQAVIKAGAHLCSCGNKYQVKEDATTDAKLE